MKVMLTRFAVLLLASAALVSPARGAAAMEEIKVQLDWILGGKHVPFFVARDRGHFRGKGLEVRLLEGRGSLQPAQFVDTKQADYGYGDLITAIEVMAKGGKNRAIGTGMVFQGGGYIFLEESGIKVPKDLEGKNFGTTPGDFGQVLLPALGAVAKFDHTKVIIKNIDAAVRTPAFFERKIDFLAGARGSSVPRMAVVAKRQNKKIGYLFFRDMGINSYGHVIQVHEERLKNNPDQIKRFMAALMDAWEWSIKNPQQALDIFMNANPEKDREITAAEMQDGLGDILDPETKEFGLGYMKEAMMKRSADLANKYAGLDKPIEFKMMYTNQFIAKK